MKWRASMSHAYVLWIATVAYAFHILEEYELNWYDWARNVLKLPVSMTSFYIVNSLVIVLGVCCAAVGWQLPVFALSFPAVMAVNATVFHVVPVIRTRIFSPGVVTAVAMFYPVAAWSYYSAWEDGVLTVGTVIGSAVAGIVMMAYPIVLLKIRHFSCFQYASPETASSNPATP
jgi:uncharacterized protein with HXXEE motif